MRIYRAFDNFFRKLKTVTGAHPNTKAIYSTVPIAIGAGAAANTILNNDSSAQSFAEGGLVDTKKAPRSYTDQELDDLALTAYAENRDKLPEAIAWTARNRKEKWGKYKSYSDVVRDKNAYAPWNATDPQYHLTTKHDFLKKDPVYQDVRRRVQTVLDDKIPDITEGATGFYNRDGMKNKQPSKYHEDREETVVLYGHRFNSDKLKSRPVEEDAFFGKIGE